MEDDDLLDPFSSAENIASLVLDQARSVMLRHHGLRICIWHIFASDLTSIMQVLQEGGRLLYDSYIARKSFSFAAEAVCEATCFHVLPCAIFSFRSPALAELCVGKGRRAWGNSLDSNASLGRPVLIWS